MKGHKIMKIIHCADVHLDSKLTANLSPEKAKQRRRELLITFQKMISYAVENEVEAIIIAGDLFDTENVSQLAKNTVYQGIIANPQINFYYLQGNHDNGSFLSSLEHIPENLFMFTNQWQYYLANSNSERNIIIAGVELNKNNTETIYNSLTLDEDLFNIVVLHGQETNSIVKNQGESINLKGLQNKGIDYLALGHIHSYKFDKLDVRGKYCYSGCLEARGFDEVGEHGFVLLEIDEITYQYKHQFIEFAGRSFHQYNVDISNCKTTAEITDKIQRELDRFAIPAKDMLKINLIGDLTVDAEKDMEMLNQQFKNDYYLVKIYDQTTLKIDYQQYTNDQSLKGEFVRLLKSQNQISEEDKANIIQIGLLALAGEEIQ